MLDRRGACPKELLPERGLGPMWGSIALAHTIWSDMNTYRRSEPRSLSTILQALAGCALRPPVFLVGSPRSGTTFLGSAIARLPGFSYHFEPVLTKRAAAYVYLGCWSDEKGRAVFRGTYSLLLRLHAACHLTLVDKTPRLAFLLEEIAKWFPGARFVHLVRDGRDAAVSWARRPWLQAVQDRTRYEPGGYKYGSSPPFWVEIERADEFRSTSDLHRAIWGWRRHVEAAASAFPAMDQRNRLEIRYEDLVSEPRATGARLALFLGSNPSDSFNEVLDGAREGSVRHGRDLATEEANIIDREAGQLLESLGYR